MVNECRTGSIHGSVGDDGSAENSDVINPKGPLQVGLPPRVEFQPSVDVFPSISQTARLNRVGAVSCRIRRADRCSATGHDQRRSRHLVMKQHSVVCPASTRRCSVQCLVRAALRVFNVSMRGRPFLKGELASAVAQDRGDDAHRINAVSAYLWIVARVLHPRSGPMP